MKKLKRWKKERGQFGKVQQGEKKVGRGGGKGETHDGGVQQVGSGIHRYDRSRKVGSRDVRLDSALRDLERQSESSVRIHLNSWARVDIRVDVDTT